MNLLKTAGFVETEKDKRNFLNFHASNIIMQFSKCKIIMYYADSKIIPLEKRLKANKFLFLSILLYDDPQRQKIQL